MFGKWLYKTIRRIGVNKRDVALMSMSLLLAFTIWFLYNMRLNYSAPLKVQVTAQSNIPGHFQRSSSPTLVEARCRTKGFAMLRIERKARKPVIVKLDADLLHPVSDGLYSISANELSAYVEDIFGPDVVLESFLSPSFSFRFPEENHKKVPVTPVKLVDFKKEYMQSGEMTVFPDSVIVYGESAYIESIDCIRTERISLSNISSSVSGTAALEIPKNVRLSDNSVRYHIDAVRYVEVNRAVTMAVRNIPAGRQLSVYPSEALATFRCVFPVGNDHTDDIELYIDFNDFLTSVDGCCVARTDDLPSGVISCHVKPEIFECVENVR